MALDVTRASSDRESRVPKVYEAVAKAFGQEGVTEVFGLIGIANMEFMIAMAEMDGTKVVYARHEASALEMADGYARSTGRIGAATVTCGPGLTNLATPLINAARHRTPLVVLAGDLALAEKSAGNIQDINQLAFVQALGVQVQPLRSAATAAQDLRRAFLYARTERAPVVVNAPADVMNSQIEPGVFKYVSTLDSIPTRPALSPAPDSVARAVDMIVEARLPIIIAGLGAAEAREAIEAMADRIGALLATTGPAKGWFDGSPSSIGVAGGFAHRLAHEAFAAADLVIAIGASLSAETVRSGQLFPGARLLKIDIDAFPVQERCSASLDWAPGSMRPDHLVLGDARLTVDAMLSSLKVREYLARGFHDHQVFAALQQMDPRETDLADASWALQPGTVDPRSFVLKLDTLLPKECIVFVGGGHFKNFPLMFLSGFRKRRFFYTSSKSFGIIGQALTMGCGAAIANPGLPVVVFEGDGSTMMNIQELETAARCNARFLLFVMNDMAMEFHSMRRRGHDPKWGIIPTPSFSKVATSFGLTGHDVHSEDDIEPAVRSFLAGSGAHVVDVHCDREVSSPPSRRFAQGL